MPNPITSMSVQTNPIALTVKDFLENRIVNDNSYLPNISNIPFLLNGTFSLDSSISIAPEISKFINETWYPKILGSNNYIPKSSANQAISLKSSQGSTITYSEYQSGYSNFNFSSGDGKVKLVSDYNKNTLKSIGYNNSIFFVNLGDDQKLDDITVAVINKHTPFVSFVKKGIVTDKTTETLAINYIGNGYKLEFLTKDNQIFTHSADNKVMDEFHSVTISKYEFHTNNFSISLGGSYSINKISANNAYSYLSKVNLTNVKLSCYDYILTTPHVSYIVSDLADNSFLNMSSDNFVAIDKMKEESLSRIIPNVISGNNVISIMNQDGFEMNSEKGNDIIIGGNGNDTIIGGVGSDQLTGGKGVDIFSFSNSDFFSPNINGDSVFNKSVDVIKDFNLNEYDLLSFNDLGFISFYKTLNEAKADYAQLFYVNGSGKIYLNTDTSGAKYNPNIIITLTGNPLINAEGTDFNYPV
jgi:Ca2+-binding RTX toxin-like protein